MPKLNKPEYARPFNKALPEILMLGMPLETTPISNKDEPAVIMAISPAVRKIYDYIKVQVNDDVCMTKNQEDVFVENMRRLVDNGAENDIGQLQNFAILINSYRFECCNCINYACDKRDPDFPKEATDKRVK